jgi:cardiolipin synthase A/B
MKSHFSEKKLIKNALMVISILLMLCTAWISEPLLEKAIPTVGDVPQLFSNQTGDNLEKAHTQAILNAKESILFMIFALTNDSVIHALRQKSEEGIPTKVICDAKASPHIIQKLGSHVEVVRRLAKGLMHLKILVIDGKECWLGSANMTNESLNMHGNLVVAMKDPQVADLLTGKAATLQEYERKGEVLHKTFLVAGQKIELSFLPDDRKGSLRIKELMRSAQKCIKIAMFTWTRFDLVKELAHAKKRGVLVEVILDNSSAKGASAKVAALLKKEGISLAYSSAGPTLLHHKFMWIDDHLLEVGSANWTKAAFSQNDDCFLILHNLTPDQQNHMKRLWEAIKKESFI